MKIYTTYCGPINPEITNSLKLGCWQNIIPLSKEADPQANAELSFEFTPEDIKAFLEEWKL